MQRKIAEFQASYPDLQFELIDSSVSSTIGLYDSAMHTLIEGALLAVIVVLLFLRDWRATLIAAVALPLSVFPTFWAMDALGFTLNGISLLAITLVTGILVDDAIVEIENVVRHMRLGKSPYQAAIEGADEIGLAVIAITATLIAVFAPVSFMPGIAGRYFIPVRPDIASLGVHVAARGATDHPDACRYFLRDHGHHDEREGPIMRAYRASSAGRCATESSRCSPVSRCRRLHRVDGPAALGLHPEAGQRPYSVHARTGAGGEARRHGGGVRPVVSRIRALPEVTSVFVDGGRQVGGKKETRRATLTVNLTPKNMRAKRQSGRWSPRSRPCSVRSPTSGPGPCGTAASATSPGSERARRRRRHGHRPGCSGTWPPSRTS